MIPNRVKEVLLLVSVLSCPNGKDLHVAIARKPIFHCVTGAVQKTSLDSPSQCQLQLTDLLSVIRPLEVAISPDGARVAYVYATPLSGASHVAEDDRSMKSKKQIWVQHFEGSDPLLIGPQDADNFQLAWSPDGKKLAFYTSSGEQNYLAIWSVFANAARVTEVAVNPSAAAQWTPDGRHLLVSRAVNETKNSTAQPEIKILTTAPQDRSLAEGDVVNSRAELTGPGFGNNGADAVDLLLVDEESGATDTVASKVVATRYQLSPDGTRLFYTTLKGSINSDSNWRSLFDITIVNLSDRSVLTVARNTVQVIGSRSVTWSYGGSMIAFLGGNVHDDYHEPALAQKSWQPDSWWWPVSCYIVDLKHPGTLRRIGYRQFAPFEALWSSDDTAVYAVSSDLLSTMKISLATHTSRRVTQGRTQRISNIYTMGSGNHLYALGSSISAKPEVRLLDLDADRSELVFQKFQGLSGLTLSRDGTRAAYIGQDVSHPPDVWVADNHFSVTRQMTHLNSEIESRVPTLVKSVAWRVHGVTLYGTLLLPESYQPGRRYPMILKLYGGREGGGARSLFGLGGPAYWDLQLLAAHGYVVFSADDALRMGSPMHDTADTALPGVDRVVAMGIADPNRLGVFGWSYGGYSALSLIVQTNRFKAAVSGSGMSNLLTYYSHLHPDGSDWTGFTESRQGHIGGTPWQNRDRYIENSPFFYLDRIQTPVLLEYGDADTVVDPFNSRETFVALRRLGKTATLIDYIGEGHALSKTPNQIDFSKRIIKWFDKYLKD